MKRLIVGALLCAAAVMVPSAQMPTYGVTVTVAKNVDAAKFKTYSWTKGGPSADKAVDAQIMAAVDRELDACPLGAAADAIIVDMHCEATSESIAMGWYLDGRVSAVVGTHRHVQMTACRVSNSVEASAPEPAPVIAAGGRARSGSVWEVAECREDFCSSPVSPH